MYFLNSRFFSLIVLLAFLFTACSDDDKIKDEVAEIEIDLEVNRFDKEFAAAEPENLHALRQKYPYLFPRKFEDSVWVEKMNDTLQSEIEEEVFKKFPDFKEETLQLELFLKHLKYYFPKSKTPSVVTLAEEVDYRNKVVLADSILLISLDNYLGSDHRFYEGLPKYIAKLQDKKFMLSDVSLVYADQIVPRQNSRTFLSTMIHFGKKLYLNDLLLPFVEENFRMNYTEDELAWAKANEKQIWLYMIEKELLYSTKNDLRDRFINMGPYTKFYLELDNESPPRLGQFIGRQIVQHYMTKYPETSLQELMQMSAKEIFQKANYKPHK
ncbi:MAG: gliding motility lipoprotein GldB [Bacteroidota bacterium]